MAQSDASPVVAPLPRRMWVVWLLFFFQFAAIGVYFTFLNVYFRQSGLSGTQIGLLNMITALVGVGGSTLWGFASDRTGKTRLIIAAGAAGSLIANQFIPFVHSFYAYLLLGSLGAFMNSAPSTLVDSSALSLLGARRDDYGRYRFGGSIGYIVTALTSGYLFDRVGLNLIFPAYGVMMAGLVIVALLLPPVPRHTERRPRGEIGKMITQRAWILFITCIFLAWIASNAAIMFLPVSLNAMGAEKSLISWVMTIGAIVEIPFMLFSGALLRRFGSNRLLLVSMGLMVLRFFFLGIMPAPIWGVLINSLNGPAFVLFWNSAVTYANKTAPPGMAGTAQGLIASTISLSGVVSSLLSGWLFDQLGPNGIFLVMAGCCLLALALFSYGSLLQRSRKSAETEPLA